MILQYDTISVWDSHLLKISPVQTETDIIVKKLFCQIDKRVFYMAKVALIDTMHPTF